MLLVGISAFVVFSMFFMSFGMMGSGTMTGGTWGGGMWDGHMWGDGTMSGWIYVVGLVMHLLFLAAVIGGGYLVYRAVSGSEPEVDQPLETLRLAYARGELTDEEYEQRREVLEQDSKSR